MANACNWTDLIGAVHAYSIYLMRGTWNDVDGNYIFAKWENGFWWPLYIGEGNFKTRLTDKHEKWTPAVVMGATHVHAHVNRNAISRTQEEKLLIQAYNPPLNIQHRVA